jgi:hypothetical protein
VGRKKATAAARSRQPVRGAACPRARRSVIAMKHFSLLASLLAATPAAAQFFQLLRGPEPAADLDRLAYDAGRDRMVGLGFMSGTWEHDGVSWRAIATAQRPRDRDECGIVYDGQRVLLYGGGTPIGQSPPALDDLWSYDGTAWTQVQFTGGPGPRRGHAMVHDTARQRVVLFGGTDMQGNFPGDTWEWDGTAWSQAATGGPGPRVWHRMVYDPVRQRTVLASGALNPFVFDDTWEWDGTSWTQTATGGYSPRIAPGMVFDTVLQRTLLIGGWDAGAVGGPLADVHAYDPVAGTWTQLAVAQTAPLQQVVAAAHDRRRARTLIVTWDALQPAASFAFRSVGAAAATYAPYGQGCAGGLGQVPALAAAAGTTPARGSRFTAEVTATGNAGVVLFATGFSAASWGGVALPLPLAAVGMPGCSVLAAFDVVLPLATDLRSRRAEWSWDVPNLRALAGLAFYQQAVTLDASAANGFGGTSNAAAGVVQ